MARDQRTLFDVRDKMLEIDRRRPISNTSPPRKARPHTRAIGRLQGEIKSIYEATTGRPWKGAFSIGKRRGGVGRPFCCRT
jgi:hypothetical protein